MVGVQVKHTCVRSLAVFSVVPPKQIKASKSKARKISQQEPPGAPDAAGAGADQPAEAGEFVCEHGCGFEGGYGPRLAFHHGPL
jgi:hypothetical protein